ncbi:NAD-dependent epimerase/dehydratase family protein [Rarobacter faecitabidus]|uniref:Nucleoside-diphosphate-sugar epimerase n=1 Tax=Rarobacter faecitabidus TaxID=13243 RepID=A0A542ZWN2_RARFA|nr:NAD-dependent epimerase/dehydratase family protein [Rarobacter faecitabidus]TQL64742.1 nucleoside-diphosphate-sugar epimerase [Rarobacter faecitabidus]
MGSACEFSSAGRATGIPGVDSVAVDASAPDALTVQASGAETLYNCANPGSYTEWERLWPPLAASILTAAERSGAVLVTASNLYGYGPPDGPMTRETPLRPSDHKGELRARMWQEALAVHEAGRVRVTEARASDYIGPTLPVSSGLLAMYAKATLAGKTASVFGDPDQPHAWTAIDDVAATLAAVGRDEKAWGSAWIVPSAPPRSARQVPRALGESVGMGEPRLRKIPTWTLRVGGFALPILREVTGALYQFERPYIADGTETTERFGVDATEWEETIASTARAWRARL